MPCAIRGTPLDYYAAPKVACTSLKLAILRHNDPALSDRVAANEGTEQLPNDVHEIYVTRRFRPWWYAHRLAGRRPFCIVRDPLERFVSGYRNRILFHRDLERPGARERIAAAGLETEPDPDRFVDQLERYCEIDGKIRHHFRPMVAYLGPIPLFYHRVFPMSELDGAMEHIRAYAPDIALGHSQTGGPKVRLSDFSEASRKKLRAYYRIDYRIWGQYF